MTLLCISNANAESHPHDGPHANFRITINDSGVEYEINCNLAFIDQVAPTARENGQTLSQIESEIAVAALLEHLRYRCQVSIDGQFVQPVIESSAIHSNPPSILYGVFPKSGMRGLIQARIVFHFPSASPPKSVEMAWNEYPGFVHNNKKPSKTSLTPPSIETLLVSEGKARWIQFETATPTIVWNSSRPEKHRISTLSTKSANGSSKRWPLITYGTAFLSVFCIAVALFTTIRGKTPVVSAVLTGVMLVAAVLSYDFKFEIPWTTQGRAELSTADTLPNTPTPSNQQTRLIWFPEI